MFWILSIIIILSPWLMYTDISNIELLISFFFVMSSIHYYYIIYTYIFWLIRDNVIHDKLRTTGVLPFVILYLIYVQSNKYIFLSNRMGEIRFQNQTNRIHSEHISLLLGFWYPDLEIYDIRCVLYWTCTRECNMSINTIYFGKSR